MDLDKGNSPYSFYIYCDSGGEGLRLTAKGCAHGRSGQHGQSLSPQSCPSAAKPTSFFPRTSLGDTVWEGSDHGDNSCH